ncbi:hypothetical protein V1477_003097 [Vespula maculifrons]|uniref:Uncharacterized protein n=1 Tax=Vespula maculifrons TaxID=7453 RepID=A0ABD2CUV2_VESMC
MGIKRYNKNDGDNYKVVVVSFHGLTRGRRRSDLFKDFRDTSEDSLEWKRIQAACKSRKTVTRIHNAMDA